jgi:hypothetical protein
MNTRDILSAIDAEIARLQSARSLLVGTAQVNEEGGHPHPNPFGAPKKENHVRRWEEEDRRGTAPALGEAESFKEEVGLPFLEDER